VSAFGPSSGRHLSVRTSATGARCPRPHDKLPQRRCPVTTHNMHLSSWLWSDRAAIDERVIGMSGSRAYSVYYAPLSIRPTLPNIGLYVCLILRYQDSKQPEELNRFFFKNAAHWTSLFCKRASCHSLRYITRLYIHCHSLTIITSYGTALDNCVIWNVLFAPIFMYCAIIACFNLFLSTNRLMANEDYNMVSNLSLR